MLGSGFAGPCRACIGQHRRHTCGRGRIEPPEPSEACNSEIATTTFSDEMDPSTVSLAGISSEAPRARDHERAPYKKRLLEEMREDHGGGESSSDPSPSSEPAPKRQTSGGSAGAASAARVLGMLSGCATLSACLACKGACTGGFKRRLTALPENKLHASQVAPPARSRDLVCAGRHRPHTCGSQRARLDGEDGGGRSHRCLACEGRHRSHTCGRERAAKAGAAAGASSGGKSR